MGKVLRCWHKLQCFPLRLSLLILCVWAVYVISTGFIYPSDRSGTTFQPKLQLHSRGRVHRNLSFPADLNQPFEHFQLAPERDAEKKSHYEELSTSGKFGTLLRDDTNSNGTKELVSKRGSHKRSLTYRLFEKKYRNNDISHHVQENIINGLGQNSNDILVKDANNASLGPKKQAKKNSYFKNNPQQSAIDWYKSETYLPNVGNIKNYGLTTSSSTHDHTFLATYGYHKRSFVYSGADKKAIHPSHASRASSEVRVILLWSPLYKGWNFLPEGSKTFSHCTENHCEVTSDRNRLKDSDAVIFHIRTMSLLDLPPIRLPHQKWIFFSLEPPPQSHFPGFHFMHRMFNWTMTYRHDSDIVIPYGRVIPGSFASTNQKRWEILWKKKTRPIIWMVSHCDTYGKREHFVRQLQKFIDVDVMGGCGSAVCLYNQTYKCLEAFSKRYKFFLAFENSICDDYVTEKFFRALRYDIVPVVLGGADYKAFAPPGSYINAADFQSPKNLADYLHNVSENSTLSREYFKWKDYGYIIEDKPSHCSLCEKIHSLDFKTTSTYADIEKWWVEKSHCTKWTPK